MADGKIEIDVTANIKELKKDLTFAERELKKASDRMASLKTKVSKANEEREKSAFGGITEQQSRENLKLLEADYKKKVALAKSYSDYIKQFSVEQQKYMDKIAPHAELLSEGSLKSKLKKKNITPMQFDSYVDAKRGLPGALDEATIAKQKAIQALNERELAKKKLEETTKTPQELLNEKNLDEVTAKVKELTRDVKLLRDMITEAQQASDNLGTSATNSAKKTSKATKKSAKDFSFLQKRMKKFHHSFRALGFQIRTALLWGTLLMPAMKVFDIFRQNLLAVLKTSNAFNASLANLKGTMWTGIAPAFKVITDWVTILMNKLSVAITYLSTFANYLLGLGSASKKAGKNMADAAKKAKDAKSGKGKDDLNFASWDTIQQLKKKDTGAAGAEEVAPTFEQDFTQAEAALEKFKKILEDSGWYGVGVELGKKITDGISNIDSASLAQTISQKIISALQLVSGLLSGIDFSVLGQKIREFITNIDWLGIAQEAVRLLGEGLIAALEFLEGLLGVGPFKGLFQGLADAVRWVLDAIMELFNFLRGDTTFKEFFDSLSAGQLIFLGFITVLGIALGVMKTVSLVQKGLTLAQTGLTTATGLVSKAFTFMTSPIGLAILAITAIIAVVVLLIKHWDEIKAKTIEVWNKIKEVVGGVVDKVVEKLTAFKDRVVEIFTSIKDKIKDIWEGIKQTAKDALNWLIGKFESFINWIIHGINHIGFDVPDWLQDKLGFEKFGFNIQDVSLPRLAQGTVVNPGHQFAAILGDNRREQEIVSPLSTMKQAFMEAIAESGVNRTGGNVTLQVDGTTFARVMNPYMQRETRRIGVNAIKGGI